MDTDTDTLTPADTITAHLAVASAAIRAATRLFNQHNLPGDLKPTSLYEDLAELRSSSIRSHSRALRDQAGMSDEPDWFDTDGIYAEIDPAWNCVVIEQHERNPRVAVTAPNATEANRRAVTYAHRQLGLSSALPDDGPRQRLAGAGTRTVGENRWEVRIEGW